MSSIAQAEANICALLGGKKTWRSLRATAEYISKPIARIVDNAREKQVGVLAQIERGECYGD